jgi:hypothetical protein
MLRSPQLMPSSRASPAQSASSNPAWDITMERRWHHPGYGYHR